MANRTFNDMRVEISQAYKDFVSSKITSEEALNIAEKCGEEGKAFEKQIKEQLKSIKKTRTTVAEVVTEPIKLTSADIELAKKIKAKLRKTAETIVEIGETITKAVEKQPKGYKDLFYKAVGMSARSAQRYMQIANHVKIQALKKKQDLEGKTMTDLLLITSPSQISTKSINTSKVANGIYTRYKDNPNDLEKIMEEIQKLIDDSIQVKAT